ncbi:hypothetical protein Dimus_020680 [Dionaea muscipula]
MVRKRFSRIKNTTKRPNTALISSCLGDRHGLVVGEQRQRVLPFSMVGKNSRGAQPPPSYLRGSRCQLVVSFSSPGGDWRRQLLAEVVGGGKNGVRMVISNGQRCCLGGWRCGSRLGVKQQVAVSWSVVMVWAEVGMSAKMVVCDRAMVCSPPSPVVGDVSGWQVVHGLVERSAMGRHGLLGGGERTTAGAGVGWAVMSSWPGVHFLVVVKQVLVGDGLGDALFLPSVEQAEVGVRLVMAEQRGKLDG